MAKIAPVASVAAVASRARKLQVTGWLLFAAIAGALTLVVWIVSAVKPAAATNKKITPTITTSDPLARLNNHTATPSELNNVVKPLTYDTVVRDMRNYPPQFKDSRFLKTNTGKWTLQVMNVAEHEVVADYLNKRDDKDKFNYFRIADDHNQKRYVVTYGLYGSAQEAMAASKSVDFGLPKNVTTFPEEIRLYLSEIDEYEVNAPIQNIGTKTPKEVKLRTAPKVLAAPKAKTRSQDTQDDNDDDDSGDDDTQTAAPARSIKESANRSETLVIQEKPVPAFVERPQVQPHPVTTKPATPKPTTTTTQHTAESKPAARPVQKERPAPQKERTPTPSQTNDDE